MVAQKRKREEYESDVVSLLRRGSVSILEVIAMKLPDVFAAEILPKLDVFDTLSLAQVSKSYNDAVWSVEGVRCMDAKIEAYAEKTGMVLSLTIVAPSGTATATCPRSGPSWSLGRTSIRETPRGRLPCTLRLTLTDR